MPIKFRSTADTEKTQEVLIETVTDGGAILVRARNLDTQVSATICYIDADGEVTFTRIERKDAEELGLHLDHFGFIRYMNSTDR